MRGVKNFMLLIFIAGMLQGCAQRQFVSEPYARWGAESIIKRPDINLPLILRMLSPSDPAKAPACVLLVHGMNEHIGRYQEIARYLSRRFIIAGFDFNGHGLSNHFLQQADQAVRADAGKQEVSDAYLAQISLRDLEPMRLDLDLALRRFIAYCDKQSGSEKPVFIVSHSLGSLVTASYLLQARNKNGPTKRVQGIVLLAPAFAVSEPPGWRGWLQNPIIRLSFYAEEHFMHFQDEPLPQLIFNQLLSLMIVPVFDGLFEFFSWPGLRNLFTPAAPVWVLDYLTNSEEEKARLRSDNWIVRRSLLRFVKGIEAEIVLFRRKMDHFAKPYLLISSEYDPITPVWGSKNFARVTLKNDPANKLIVLPNLRYHQHLFLEEPLRQEILSTIERWLDRRIYALTD
ncbi:MAG: alpha/beta hydrolase [Nitrosomonas sp.]|nr:alpha/beta hydrolase [Nitrosomonas sp.]